MKDKTLPIRFHGELYEWLKDYSRRKHSNMAAVITGLLVQHKETEERIKWNVGRWSVAKHRAVT